MTGEEKVGYFANLNRVKAQDIIHQGNFNETDYDGIYRLYLAAFDDKDLARRQRTKALERYTDAKIAQAAAARR